MNLPHTPSSTAPASSDTTGSTGNTTLSSGSSATGSTAEAGTLDAIIVGQGIAGSVLAYTLLQRGLSVRIVDDGHKTSASMVAAGMVNPVLGQRLNKAWEIELCLPAAIELYRHLEQVFGKQFFFPKRILKLINTEKEAEFLEKRLQDPSFAPYLGALHAPDSNIEAGGNQLRDEFGSIEITGGGYLDALSLLESLRGFFDSRGLLVQQAFTHADVDLRTEGLVRWQGLAARRIIFAEGWRIMQNPFFAAYSFQATKGQILTVSSERPLPDHVVNRSKWLIPQGETQAWIGSTYERDQTEPTLTAEGRREILNKVQSFLPGNPLTVQSQRAGIRLACHDHIPRVGFLPAQPRIGVFNAFSSKGNCFAPYLANCMADNILNGTPLPPKADIARKKVRKDLASA